MLSDLVYQYKSIDTVYTQNGVADTSQQHYSGCKVNAEDLAGMKLPMAFNCFQHLYHLYGFSILCQREPNQTLLAALTQTFHCSFTDELSSTLQAAAFWEAVSVWPVPQK